MDDRQTRIKEGAGLENSRVNQEFIDFLNKWSSPVLLTLAVAALAWAGLQWYQRQQVAKVNQAFSELEAATAGGNPSPASLKTIANEYGDVRSVAELALLETSNVYLQAFVMGVAPGAQPDPATRAFAEADILDEDQRMQYLEQAGQMARQVLDLTGGEPGKALLTMQAQSRLAAVEEGQRNFDAARAMYEQLRATAAEHEYPAIVAYAQGRTAELDELQNLTPLPAADDLRPLPGEEETGLSPEQLEQLMDSLPEVESAPEVMPDAVPDTADPGPEPELAPEEPAGTGDGPQSP